MVTVSLDNFPVAIIDELLHSFQQHSGQWLIEVTENLSKLAVTVTVAAAAVTVAFIDCCSSCCCRYYELSL